jgi:phage portal protein BeeE
MIGIGAMPTYNNIEALSQQYYSQCLQSLIEEFEAVMDDGLGLETPTSENKQYGIELDLTGLLRMDTATQVKTSIESIGGGLTTTNEERRKFDLSPVAGGDVIWRQQQYFSLEALNQRDKQDPFAKPAPALPPPAPQLDPAEVARATADYTIKAIEAAKLEMAA